MNEYKATWMKKLDELNKEAEYAKGHGTCEDADGYANVRQDNPERRSIQTMHDMSVRRQALIKFYERVIDRFEGDLLERLIFIQCFAALDASEGHGLAWLYTDDFNETLIPYQREKKHDVD